MKNLLLKYWFIYFFLFLTSLFSQGLTISSNATFSLGSAILSLSNDFTNNGTFNPQSGTLEFYGSNGDQTLTDVAGTALNNIIINKASGDFLLSQNMTVNGTLTCTSGDVNLNGNVIYLGTSANLVESSGATVKGTSGQIETTRSLNAPSNLNVAGLGLALTTTQDLGSTRIIRKHSSQATNTGGSILRYFDITPTNNSGLSATLTFYYDADEINGLTEADLQIFKSTNSGSSWLRSGGTINVPGKYITLNGVDDFSLWTLSNNESVSISNAGGNIICAEKSSVQVFSSVFLTDPDDQYFAGAVFEITNNYIITEDALTFTNKSGITGSWDQATGKLTLSGVATKDAYSEAVRSVMYQNSSTNAVKDIRTVSLYVNDGAGNSNTVTKQIEITSSSCKPYISVNTGGVLNEGGTLLINDQMLSAADEDGSVSAITYIIKTEPTYGQLSVNSALLKSGNSISFTQNDIANGKVSYSHNAGETKSDFFTFQLVDDDGEISRLYTFSITIEKFNDPPYFESLTDIVIKEDEKIFFGIHNWYDCINDPDDPDSLHTFRIDCGNENISFTRISDTLYEITAAPNFYGLDSARVVIKDFSLDSCYTKVAVVIEPVNDMPEITGFPSTLEITRNQLYTLEMKSMLSDVETDVSLLNVSFEVEKDSIFASYNSNTGMLSIVSIGSFEGETLLIVTVTDEGGGVGSVEVLLNITREITGFENEKEFPTKYILYSNYPNPFNPSTKIRYGIPSNYNSGEDPFVQLKIFDLLGREIAALVEEYQKPGFYEYVWNAENLTSGIYLCQLSVKTGVGVFQTSRKMILMK